MRKPKHFLLGPHGLKRTIAFFLLKREYENMKIAPSHVYIFNLLHCILNYSTLFCLCTFLLKVKMCPDSHAYLF